ncbi:MAG: hypothetical protein ACEQSF_01465 [Solirubrobacteraceae bacterium]
MKNHSIISVILLILFCFSFTNAQKSTIDSIYIKASLNESKNEITVQQKFHLANQKDTLFFNAWINAYSNKKTKLANSKIEEQKPDLYFEKQIERGRVYNLTFYGEDNKKLNYTIKENEFIVLENFNNNKKNIVKAEYTLKIPNSSFTEYGVDKEKNYYLKYFFLQPMLNKDNYFVFEHFLDMETEQTLPYYYHIELDNINNKHIVSNLSNNNNALTGISNQILEINLLNNIPTEFNLNNYKISFTFPYKESVYTKNIIENQLKFLENNVGELTNKKLIINNNNKKNNFLFGVDDIQLTKKYKIESFSAQEKEALRLFYMISEEYLNNLIKTDKNKDYWIKSGLKIYLFINYIESSFPKKLKLLGELDEKINILGIKPVKLSYLSKLPFTERFNNMYLFLSRFGNDQTLNQSFEKLNIFNQDYVGGNRTGLLFKSIEDYLPGNEFETLLKTFIKANINKTISGESFVSYFEKNSSKPMYWFNESFIKNDFNIDFKLKKIKKVNDSLLISIKNKTNYNGPFKISGFKNDEVFFSKWVEKSDDKLTQLKIPSNSINNVVLNLDSYLPEHFDQDNYKKIGGFYNNFKKIKITPFKSIENPKVNTVVVVPNINWNNQSRLKVNLSISNLSFLPKKYTYTFNPSYNFGSNKFQYSISGGFFEKWKVGLIEKFFLNTNYSIFNNSLLSETESYGASSSVLFRRYNQRLPINSRLYVSYQSFKRGIPTSPTLSDLDYKAYQLREIGYNYSNNGYLHDFAGGINLENSNLFNKITLEGYYRIKLTKESRINYRLFGGFFLNNNALSNSFDYGISRVNDYKFRNRIIDRSNKQIPLNQQYILADAGFKSIINNTANQWIISNNIHFNLNKKIGVYTDFGLFKNSLVNTNFIYDTGVSFTAIEDFLELYFPLQSSLGFEPELKNYQQKIRFVFNLDLGMALSYLGRGKF